MQNGYIIAQNGNTEVNMEVKQFQMSFRFYKMSSSLKLNKREAHTKSKMSTLF